jgi:hypothetical protein
MGADPVRAGFEQPRHGHTAIRQMSAHSNGLISQCEPGAQRRVENIGCWQGGPGRVC